MTEVLERGMAAGGDVDPEPYRISVEPCQARVRVMLGSLLLADSHNVLIMNETRHDPAFYFPPEDVRRELLEPDRQHTHCPFKGNASYWNVGGAGVAGEKLVWSYQEPDQEAAAIAGYLAFYSDRVSIVVEGRQQPTVSPAPTPAIIGNPLTRWLLHDAWQASDPSSLVSSLAACMRSNGVPISRLWLFMRTLHPLLFSTSYGWLRGRDEIEVFRVPYEVLQSDRFLKSPLAPIFEGAGGVRRRLDIPKPVLDFPILEDLYREGATDYVAMPMTFSDGQINVVTMAANRPGGFTTAQLGHLHEALPLLSRLVEVHAMRQNATNLLETYLGRHSGKRVMDGLVRRGDGERIYAVLWFCDLRDSTPLADSMNQEDFLALLDEFFECMAGAVLDHGGEVLRFIGDAVLAIFPIATAAPEIERECALTRRACQQGLDAAHDAAARLGVLNQTRAAQGQPSLGWGIGLHLGEVTYGNIGTPTRLEFTVIGAAANEAARIEGLCKTLGQQLLISAAFAHHSPLPLKSLGPHQLRGVGDTQEIFTMA